MRLETNRLYIRRLHITDWQAMKEIFTDFNQSKYAAYDMPLPTEDEEAKALTQRFADSNSFFAIFLKETSDMLGYVCFHKDGDRYDLGYCFHSAHHSKGYAYESIRALIDFWVSDHGAVHFTAGTALENAPSCKLLDKLGFTCVSTETVSFDNVFSFQAGIFVLNASH
ncbi:MAG: GNAT family N-acetyltransferase [Clostridia bacterium]|nr:GNAT family N-acetyltransferase [Clostridia bacterium]